MPVSKRSSHPEALAAAPAGRLASGPARPEEGQRAAGLTGAEGQRHDGQTGSPVPAADPSRSGRRDGSSRDPVAVRSFIERFTTQLAQAGFPRTPARIFVALLTADSSTLTAAELGDMLQISAASVSSGVRYLLHVGLATAEGEPGSRRLHYRMSQQVWQDIVHIRDRQFRAWAADLRLGVEALGPASPAGARLAETVRYFEFISGEMTGLLARWQAAFADAGPEAGQGS